jgi:hypothetical protein
MARPRQLSLGFDAWPVPHQDRYIEARRRRALFDGSGKAAHWADDTDYGCRKRWSMWLHFLNRTGRLNPALAPEETITWEALAAYIEELQCLLRRIWTD